MKKKNVINLIKYYAEKNDMGFKDEAYEIAKEFESDGDYQLSEYIVSVLSNSNSFITQSIERESEFLKKVVLHNDSLPLPIPIKEDIDGIINAISHNIGVNKFLFEGAPFRKNGNKFSAHSAPIFKNFLWLLDLWLVVTLENKLV